MQATVSSPASTASRIASAAKGGGTKIMLVLAPVSRTASGDGVEDGAVEVRRPALPWSDARHDIRAVFDAALRVETPLVAG